MCAKDDLVGRKGPLSTSTQTPNHVDTFGLDFAFSFAAWLQRIKCTLGDVDSLFADNILLLIAFIISYRLFADELVYALSQFFSGNTDYPVRWWNIQQSLLDGATVVPIIISVDKTQLLLISGDVAAWLVYVTIGNLSSGFIPTTKIRDPLLKSQVYHYCMGKLLSPLENAAKSGILLACADRRTRQCYLTICAILADYEEQVLLTGVKKNRYCTRCTKHYNFNIYVSLATDTLHLLLKGLVMKILDFMQDITILVTQESSSTQLNERFRQVMHSTGLKRFNNKRAFTEAIIQQLIAVVSLLFVSKAPFALHFIRAVCDLHALTHIIQDIRMYGALDSICTRANSEAHHITMVKQFYSMTNKKEYILQICLHNSRRTALLAADYATVVKQNRTYSTRVTRPLLFRRLRWSILGIQPHSTKLPLSEVAANIAISDFIYAAAVFDCLDVDLSWVSRISVQIYSSIKCWRSSSKRHNDPEHCDEEVVRCAPNWQQTGLWRRDYVWVQEFEHGDNRRQSRTVTDDGKHMAYIGAFSEVLLFNNNRQIDNTTGMLSVRRRAWNAAPKRRTLQAFKFYDLSTIIRSVHLVLRDLPDLTTRTTMSYYVNNYIDWDEYNRLYSPTFDINLLRMLREYRRKRT
ncbi:hypothetical protein HBI64_222650 [Parastagonospora nodorum]|nr:hypothetical protein HBI64_222650 [Parastagonospora nodorum]